MPRSLGAQASAQETPRAVRWGACSVDRSELQQTGADHAPREPQQAGGPQLVEAGVLVSRPNHGLFYLVGRGDRVLISDLNLPAVRKALSAIEPNAKFRNR